jgi:hypothetical protein
MPTPAADQPVSFDTDIKPLFRPRDRESMTFAFDLWDEGDVRANGEAILERLREGSMPCDGSWPDDRVELLGRWLATGATD